MYIFLDIDGVLNKKSDWRKIYSLNDECVRAFREFLRHIENPKIVFSSTWRSGMSRDGEISDPLKEVLEKIGDERITSADRTAVAPDEKRDREIDYYLRRHPADSYVIIDDDETLFTDGKRTKNLYLTDAGTGFTVRDGKRILKRIK